MRSTRQLLRTAPDARMFQAHAAPVLAQMLTTAAVIDGELADIERVAEPRQVRAALAVVAPQARQLIETSYTARHTGLRTAAAAREPGQEGQQPAVAHDAYCPAASRP